MIINENEIHICNRTKNFVKENIFDEENNLIDNNRIMILNKTIFKIKINYFYLGNTINFYFPFTNIYINKEIIEPPFSINKNYKFPILIIMLFISYFYLIYFIFFIYFLKITKYNYIYLLLLFIGTIFSLLIMLLNPGININSINNKKNSNYCNICKIYISKGKNNYHCKKCNVCVNNIDHHCEIFGKCITRKNIIYFFGSIIICGIINMIYLIYLIKFIIKIYKN